MKHSHIQLAHGNGGRLMRELLETLVFPALGSRESATDASPVVQRDAAGWVPVMASDSFTVQPLEFPGGNIGSLSIHGTLNDLAVSGAEPAALMINLVIEEGFATDDLRRLLESAGNAARTSGVPIIGGDTKVVPRGQGSGLLISSTGMGWRATGCVLGIHTVQAGDAILVSGPLGDHGATVLMAREAFGLSSDLVSDAADVLPLARAVRDLPGLRFMRDPTRGGLASVLHEVRQATTLGSRIQESAIPIRREVTGVCQLLGFNPLQLACEGRIVAFCAPEIAEKILQRWRSQAQGAQAALIGSLTADSTISLVTQLGGQRYLDELTEDPLPRIC